jgi:hypothetical protein
MNHAPLSQEFLKRGSPHSVRGRMWAQVLGSEIGDKEKERFEQLREAVVLSDVMIDKLIIKDVQLTACNDDNYFVMADTMIQVVRN